MNNQLKNVLFVVLIFVISFVLSQEIGDLYYRLFPSPTSVFVANFNFLIGIPLAYIFFLFLIFTAFGDNKKYWWIGILLIPAVLFELYFDLEHIYIPIVFGVAGWLLGFLISKLFQKL